MIESLEEGNEERFGGQMPSSGDLKHLSSRNVIVIAVVLIAGPALAYYINFHSFGISPSTEEWSRFGGYLGGVVAPLLSFASLIVLAQTAYELRDRDQRERENFRQADREYQQNHPN